MRYAQIRKMDISNGEGLGVALFTQGCYIHCRNCFNKDLWNYNGGNQYDIVTQQTILSLIEKPYIKRFSILGGEPLSEQNKDDLSMLCALIKEKRPEIKIWCYTGNIYEDIVNEYRVLLQYIDYLVDGPYIDELRDLTLKFRGSSNQRIINVQRSLKENKTIVYKE